jgi:hypothetical protein
MASQEGTNQELMVDACFDLREALLLQGAKPGRA